MPVRIRPFFRFMLALLLGFFGLILAEVIAALLVPARNEILNELVGRSLGLAFLVGIFTLLLRSVDGDTRPLPLALGLPFHSAGAKRFGVGALLGSGLICLAVACIAIFGSYQATFDPDYFLTIVMAVLIAIAALLEEVALRGYAFQKLMDAIGPWPATFVLSGIFGLLHANNPHATVFSAVNTALVGVLFSIAVIRTGDLWMPWGIHFAWNFTLGTLWGLPVSGLSFFAVLVKGRATGAELLTGGDYGIEASAVCAILLVLSLPVVWRLGRRDLPAPEAIPEHLIQSR